MEPEERCVGCGKILRPGEDTVEISEGVYNGKLLTEGTRWGIMHRSCFNRSIDSPEAVLEELKRLEEES